MCPDWLAPWQRGLAATAAHQRAGGHAYGVDVCKCHHLVAVQQENHHPRHLDWGRHPLHHYHRVTADVACAQRAGQHCVARATAHGWRTHDEQLLPGQDEGRKAQGLY